MQLLPILWSAARSLACDQPILAAAMDAQAYLTERVDAQIAWLGDASMRHKKAFLRYRFLGIFLGSLITILSPYANQAGPLQGWIPLLLQLSGAAVAVSGSLLALNQHQENWRRYRSLREALEREKLLFLTGSSANDAGPDSFQQFVRRVEALMAGERDLWARQAQPAAGVAQERRPVSEVGSSLADSQPG